MKKPKKLTDPKPKKILCVCFGNTCRSPMMEKLLDFVIRCSMRERFIVESAGVSPACGGQRANKHSVACMKGFRLDLRQHRSRFIGDLDLSNYDLIIVAEPEMAAKVIELCPNARIHVANRQDGGIKNPYRKGIRAYRRCVDSITRAISGMLDAIKM